MAALGAEREAALATLMERLGPVEARLAEVEEAAADWAEAGPAAREDIARLGRGRRRPWRPGSSARTTALDARLEREADHALA
jgi:hypothetical protein